MVSVFEYAIYTYMCLPFQQIVDERRQYNETSDCSINASIFWTADAKLQDNLTYCFLGPKW